MSRLLCERAGNEECVVKEIVEGMQDNPVMRERDLLAWNLNEPNSRRMPEAMMIKEAWMAGVPCKPGNVLYFWERVINILCDLTEQNQAEEKKLKEFAVSCTGDLYGRKRQKSAEKQRAAESKVRIYEDQSDVVIGAMLAGFYEHGKAQIGPGSASL